MKIILDVGANWETTEDIWNSVKEAAKTGADYVKFQIYEKGTFSLRKTEQHIFPVEILPDLHAYAHEIGIKLMFSVFDKSYIELIDPYVNNYKVAATELTNHSLLEAIGSKNKRVYLSVAWPHVKEELVYQAIDKIGHTNIVLMYCVVDYPAKTQYPLFIPKLQEKFGLKVGYSDHSTDLYANPLAADCLDAFALEKHFSIRRFVNSPDTPVSLMPEEAKSMVLAVKKDIFDLQPSRTEKYNLLTCLRSAIATKTIEAGKELEEGVNYKFLRTEKIYLDTIGPHEKHLIESKKTFVKIPKGDPIMVYHCEEDGLDQYIRQYT